MVYLVCLLCSLAIFWAHHLSILAAPVLAHHQASVCRRFALPPPRAAGLLQYIACIYFFMGVVLCGLALATGLNLNYSLWPPYQHAHIAPRSPQPTPTHMAPEARQLAQGWPLRSERRGLAA